MPSRASDLAETFGEPYQTEQAVTFKVEGDAFIVGFPGVGVCFDLSGVEASRSEFHALLRVTSTQPGTPALLHSGRFNLTSTQARTSLVKYLNARMEVRDWMECVEQVCHRVLDAVREGNPVVRLSQVEARTTPRFRVDPILVEGFPNLIFGPGGSGKSLLAAMIAMSVHDGWALCGLEPLKAPVLVCDWELDGVTYKETVAQLSAGFGIEPPDLHYRSCVAPLAEEGAAIGRYVAREGIGLVVVDSLGFAIGGDKTSQELTLRMFRAIRAWGVTTLCVDHITNDEAAGNRPYGSVYTVNAARSLWRVRSFQEEGSSELEIGIFQTKANFGKQSPVGFKVRFGDGAIAVERADVRDMESILPEGTRQKLSASMAIKTAILEGREAMTKDAIVTATGLTKDIVTARLSELVKRGDIVRLPIVQGAAAKYALRTDKEEPK